jgi:hypothetical protein
MAYDAFKHVFHLRPGYLKKTNNGVLKSLSCAVLCHVQCSFCQIRPAYVEVHPDPNGCRTALNQFKTLNKTIQMTGSHLQ